MYKGLLEHIKSATQEVEVWKIHTNHIEKMLYLINITQELILHVEEINVTVCEREEPLEIDFWIALDIYRCDHEIVKFYKATSLYNTLWKSKSSIEYSNKYANVDISVVYRGGTTEYFSSSRNYVSEEMIKSMEEYYEKQNEVFRNWLPWLEENKKTLIQQSVSLTKEVDLSELLKKEVSFYYDFCEDDWIRDINDLVSKKARKIHAEPKDYEEYFFDYLGKLKEGDALMHVILKAHHTDSLLEIDDDAIISYLCENNADESTLRRLAKTIIELNFLKKMANPEQFVKEEVVKSVPIKSKTGRKKVSVLDCIVSENKEEILAKMKAEMPKLPNGPLQAEYLNKLKVDGVLSNFPSFNALKEEELITVSKTAWNNAIKVYR